MPVDQKTMENKMDDFIQALYGVVIGVGSMEVIWKQTSPAPISAFQVMFSLFTLIIGAHDWHAYFLERGSRRYTNFLSFVPPIGALFFLGQMVGASTKVDLVRWYLSGLGYTLFNILGMFSYLGKRTRVGMRALTYLIHLLLCAIILQYFFNSGLVMATKESDFGETKWWLFGITGLTVVVLWLLPHRKKVSNVANV